MSDHTVRLKCWQIGGTHDALLISMTPKSRDPQAKGVWIPKSVCEHISRMPAKLGEWQEIEIEIPEWIAEKKELI